MVRRLEVGFKDGFFDARGDRIKRKINNHLKIPVSSVKVIDVYTIDADLPEEVFEIGKNHVFINPITQVASFEPLSDEFDYAVEVGFLPGVKDNVGETAVQALQDLLKIRLKSGESVYYSRAYHIKGSSKEEAERIAKGVLANEMVEYFKVIDHKTWQQNGPEVIVPKVKIPHQPAVKTFDLNVSDQDLQNLSKTRSLALDLGDMRTVKDYYSRKETALQRTKVGLTEKPTDVELEMIAQTQSEHCKHRIFNGLIRYSENGKTEDIDSLFETYIKRSTKEIEKDRNWIVSTFWDNSGVVRFNDNWYYCVKCETHNSPSALDPYGGAITGIVGVYRDPLGTGKGSKVIAGMYGFCTGDPFYDGNLKPRMQPRRLLEGIVEGVKDGGNKSGIPTVYGLTFFDNCWVGKPLVYVAAIGLMPAKVNGEPSHTKKVNNNDLIVMVGGRVGKDGIHGATESSLEYGVWITAGHVQIGDPFTQKKMQDFLIEARDLGLYNAITDNGAGGLSSSVGEMATMSNGCEIHLDRVPLKYAGLDPWEIMVSESQERMTIAVDPKKIAELNRVASKHDVELSFLGEFKNSGKFHAFHNGKTVAYVDMKFLHGGFPQLHLEAEWTPKTEEEPKLYESNYTDTLKKMLSRINIASNEWIQRQYDHEVQGGSAIKMFSGKHNDTINDAAVLRPILGSDEGLAVAAAINPKYSEIDTYHMTACVLDEAIRRVLAVGGSLDHICLNDNFCWPSPIYDASKNPDGKLKAAQLVRANKALYDYTTYFKTPCVSGKDSMFIDGNLQDSEGKSHRISGLPALQFTAVSKVRDVKKCVTMEVKNPGDLIYLVGATRDELGGSEYYEMLGHVGKNVPKVDKKTAYETYKGINQTIESGLLASCHGIYKGGLGVALAEIAFGGDLGIEVELEKVKTDVKDRQRILYSESPSRFLVTVKLENKAKFESLIKGILISEIGKVRNDSRFVLKGIIDEDVSVLKNAWKETFKNFW